MFSLGFYNQNRGFSLLEVLITAAIIGIVTALVVVRYGAFNNSVLLKSQAFEIALDLRETQVFAVSVRGRGSQFREEYGMYFDMANQNQYLLFLDDDANGDDSPVEFDAGEQIATSTIDSRFEISQLCANACAATLDDITISFERPDFDARFHTTTSGAGSLQDVSIVLNSLTGSEQRTINISATGQITVE